MESILNNDVPFEAPGYTLFTNCLCNNLTTIANEYDLCFQWLGATTQEARVNTWCPEWDNHMLGVPDAMNRFGGVAGAITEMARITHMPPPPPGSYRS